jgi:hypothetical protein
MTGAMACTALLLGSPLAVAAVGNDLAQAVDDAAEGHGETSVTVQGTVESTVESVTGSVDGVKGVKKDTGETVTKTVDHTSGTVEESVTAVTDTADSTVKDTTKAVTKTVDNSTQESMDAVEETVRKTTDAPAGGAGSSQQAAGPSPQAQSTSTGGHERSAEPPQNNHKTHEGDGQSSTAEPAAQEAEAPASDGEQEAGHPPTQVVASVGAFSMTPDRAAERQSPAASDPAEPLLATVRIRGEGEPFVAAVEIDTNGRELLVRLQPVDRPPLPEPDDDHGATNPFEASVAVADEGPFQATILLPGPVAEEGITAHYDDGLLTITLPKHKPQVRRIEVSTSDAAVRTAIPPGAGR